AFHRASSVTFSAMNSAVPPAAAMFATTFRPSSSSMSATTTLAPSLAKRRAVAAPMPDAAPLTTATLFARRMAASSDDDDIVKGAMPQTAWLPAGIGAPSAPAHISVTHGDLVHGPSRLEVWHLSGTVPSPWRKPDAGDRP